MESMTGYTFTPCVGSFTSPRIHARYKDSTAVCMSLPKDTGKVG